MGVTAPSMVPWRSPPPAKLILYKGFGHPINKPKQQRAVMEHNYEWFSKYIWGEEASTPMTDSTSGNQ